MVQVLQRLFIDTNLLKITKIRGYRINFRYDNILFSLNEYTDGCEYSLSLKNKETNEMLAYEYTSLDLKEYIKMKYKDNSHIQHMTYRYIDKEYFMYKINEFILKNNEK